MNREALSKEIQEAVSQLETYAKQLNHTMDVLKRTAAQGDANIPAIRECKKLLDELPDANVKQTVKTVRKALIDRAKELLKELSE